MTKSILKFSFVLLFPLMVMANSDAARSDGANSNAAERSYDIPLEDRAGDINFEFSDAETTYEVIAELKERGEATHSPLLISTDDSEVFEAAEQIQNSNAILIPFGDAAPKKSQKTFKHFFQDLPKKMMKSAQEDKFGLVIVTFNIANDSLAWIHAGHLSTFQKSANILYTAITATIFGLNKDAWAHTAAPINNFYRKMTRTENKIFSRKSSADLSFRFFSSLTLAAGLAAARLPILPVDHLINGSLDVNALTLPLMVSFASTIASFTWAENIALIDAEKQPISKFSFRRIQELRSFVLGSFATTAMLFNPQTYGIAPWMTLLGSGAIGLGVYLNSEVITNFLDSNIFLRNLNRQFSKSPVRNQCADLF